MMNELLLNGLVLAQAGTGKQIVGLIVGLALTIAFGVAAWNVSVGVINRNKDPEDAGQRFWTAAIAAMAFGVLIALWNIAGLGDAISDPSFDF